MKSKKTIILISTGLFLIGTVFLIWFVSTTQKRLLNLEALQNARDNTEFIKKFRTLYTSEVIKRLEGQGVQVTHDYPNHPGAIPLPATLSIKLGESITQEYKDASFRLYSKYPFPWRKASGGLRDDFESQAWEYLSRNPRKVFYKFINQNGRYRLRYATGDILRKSCVNCHNNHKHTPRRDWKTGDLRGILEVSLPLETFSEGAGLNQITIIGLALFVFILGLLALFTIIFHYRDENRTLEQTVNERTANLLRALDEAKTADLAKSTFINNISYEIRTPMNMIQGLNDVLQERADDNSETLDYLRRMKHSGDLLINIIDDILDYSLLEANRVKIQPVKFHLRELLKQTTSKIEPLARKKNIKLNLRIQSAPVNPVRGDPERIEQILLHLLDNAIKFTAGGQVTLSAQIESRNGPHLKILFSVSDTGVGIDESRLQSYFSPFIQEDTSHVRNKGGSGLGLAICKKLTEIMNGEIGARKLPEGGSLFWVRLPLEEL